MFNLHKITDIQKLTIAKGLCDYQYIMNHWKKNDLDFQRVYYDFYLKSGYSRTSKTDFKESYFSLFENKHNNLIDVVNILLPINNTYEFSFSTKLLHTMNPEYPIFDNKVKKYLSKNGVTFLWGHQTSDRLEAIKQDEKELIEWYKKFFLEEEAHECITWFNKCFPGYTDISKYKKIDFIIFATN